MILFNAAPSPIVKGERGTPLVARMLSLQSRLGNLLALGLMLAIGTVFLTWYYVHIAGRTSRTHQRPQNNAAAKASADMALPSLDKLDFIPQLPSSPAVSSQSAASVTGFTQDSLALPANTGPIPAPGNLGVANPAAHPTALARRLSGAAFASKSVPDTAPGPDGPTEATGTSTPTAGERPVLTSPQLEGKSAGSNNSFSTLLAPDNPSTANARLIASERLLLPKGAFLDCTLETAIDSSLPGLTTCLTATDTFGADGKVVLLERGTKLVGETRGQVQQGSSRVFVLWTEARTPSGVIVPLDSPGADELGRSGLPGEVDRHFWARFGAAILISTLDGGVQAAVQSTGRGSGAVVYSPSGATDVAGEALKETVGIAPTVIKRNGDRIQILVARDVDFSRVYELRHATR